MHQKRGFTLIELLVVIAIIGILAALVVTQLGAARVKARNSSAKSDVTEAGKAIEVFKNDDANSTSAVALSWGGAALTTIGLSTINSAGTMTNHFTSIFNGTESVASLTYGLSFSQTPGANQTYTYATHGEATVATLSNVGTYGANFANYVFSTTLDTADASSTAAFWVANGSSSSGALPVPTP